MMPTWRPARVFTSKTKFVAFNYASHVVGAINDVPTIGARSQAVGGSAGVGGCRVICANTHEEIDYFLEKLVTFRF
jgi:hypothetical protein